MSKGFFNTKTHCCVAATTCADHKIHFVYRAGTRTKPVVVEKLIGSPVPPQTGSRDPSLEQDLVLKSLWRSESRKKNMPKLHRKWEYIYLHTLNLFVPAGEQIPDMPLLSSLRLFGPFYSHAIISATPSRQPTRRRQTCFTLVDMFQ